MGMAASIETRFPFLDNKHVRYAVNLPGKTKIRFSIKAFNDRARFLTRDKWILRKIAERYLPKELSWQKKKPFNLGNPYGRLRFSDKFLKNCYLREMFDISEKQMIEFALYMPGQLRVKLLHLDVWAKICLAGLPWTEITDKLRDEVDLAP